MEAREALAEKLRPHFDRLERKTESDFWDIIEDLLKGIEFLQDSEALLILAIERSQGKPPTKPIPKSGTAEFGWLPYLFKHANESGSTDPIIIAFQKRLKDVFGSDAPTVEKILHDVGVVLLSQITETQWQYLEKHMGDHDIIGNEGSVIGDGKYEDLDADWLYAFINYLYNLLYPSGIAPFVPTGNSAKKGPYNGPIGDDKDKIKVAIIGDWGTGSYKIGEYEPANQVMQTVVNLQPDYVIHLGDVYYCGTDLRMPPGEEAANFLDMWPKAFNGRSFTLNSNHEMYGGAQGYFVQALNRPDIDASPFSMQNGYSYFALEFGPWVLVGIDAAYHDSSFLYMKGGIDTKGSDQLSFLEKVAKQYKDKKMIVFSHQTGMSTDGTTITDKETGKVSYPLLSQLQQTGITPDYWYWGHIHLGLVYGKSSVVTKESKGKTLARCVGHSSIPFGKPWGLSVGGDVIDYIAETQLHNSPLVLNGLALLTLHSDGSIQEEFYDCGDAQGKVENPPKPRWQSKPHNH